MITRVRRATVADAAAVRAVAVASWRHTYEKLLRPATIEAFLAGPYDLENVRRRIDGHHVFVAEDGATAVGYLDGVIEPDRVFLAAIYVDPRRLGRGIGTELLTALLAVAAGLRIDADVLHENSQAEAFYARRGFAPVESVTDVLFDEVVAERRWSRPAGAGPGAPTPRHASRVVVLDEADRVLLIEFRDPSTGHRWWSTPGGALEPGETYEEAAVRELAEETGLTSAALGPWIWRREHHGEFNGKRFYAVERIYLVRVPGFEVAAAGWTELERRIHLGMRWWRLEELAATSEELSPRRLPELLRHLRSAGPPLEPVDAGV